MITLYLMNKRARTPMNLNADFCTLQGWRMSALLLCLLQSFKVSNPGHHDTICESQHEPSEPISGQFSNRQKGQKAGFLWSCCHLVLAGAVQKDLEQRYQGSSGSSELAQRHLAEIQGCYSKTKWHWRLFAGEGWWIEEGGEEKEAKWEDKEDGCCLPADLLQLRIKLHQESPSPPQQLHLWALRRSCGCCTFIQGLYSQKCDCIELH